MNCDDIFESTVRQR